MLQDLYVSIPVHRETETVDSWGDTESKGNWTFDHNVQGFIQPRSGSYANANNANNPLSTHVLYCEPGLDIVVKDRLVLNGLTYQVGFVQPDGGIGGVLDHQEIPLTYLNDIDLS